VRSRAGERWRCIGRDELARHDNSGAIHLIGFVDKDQNGRERFSSSRIAQRSAMNAAQAAERGELNHLRASLLVITKHEHVAIDTLISRQLMGCDVVESGDDRDALTEEVLRALGG